MRSAVAGLLCLCVVGPSAAKGKVDQQEWVYKDSACPLRLRAGKGMAVLEATNTSRQAIVGYRLGCVAKGTGRLISSPFPFESVRLKPREKDVMISTHGNPAREKCGNELVGVVEVVFENLIRWQVIQTSANNSK